jgi:AraC-like DNA-binding protein
MLLRDFAPPPDVAQTVQLYRIVHLQFDGLHLPPPKAYPPRPEQVLAFYPFDKEQIVFDRSGHTSGQLPVVFYGQCSEVTHRHIGHRFLVLQVVFWPGALHRLLHLPATEVANQYLDATLLFGPAVLHLNEALAEAANYSDMLQLVNGYIRYLQGKARKPHLPVDAALQWMLQQQGRVGLDELANQACLSARQLERCFAERTGIGPKQYDRIIRFDKAFRLRNAFAHYSWLRIALECGFHDLQHLSKVYKAFTGLSPAAFHEVEAKAPERQFGLSEGFYRQSR